MSEWKWIWWNLGHGPTEKDDEIRELRRELEAVKERELELRRGEWVMKYFDAADEIELLRADRDRWRDLADSLARFGNCESPDCPDCDRDWKLTYQNYEQAVRGE